MEYTSKQIDNIVGFSFIKSQELNKFRVWMNIYRRCLDPSLNWRDAKDNGMSLLEFMSYHEVDWGYEEDIQEKIQKFISLCRERGLITDDIMSDVLADKFPIAPVLGSKELHKKDQQYDYDCGPNALSILLSFYDVEVSVEELSETLPTTRDGTDWMALINYLNTLEDFRVFEFQNNLDAAKKYLDRGYPLLVCWDVDEVAQWSHYSVVVDIMKNFILVMDPEDSKTVTEYDYNYFWRCWRMEKFLFAVLVPKE